MTLQASLPFVREILAEFPQAQPTADSLGEAEATDQHRYYIKGDNGGVAVRASEWICTHLAEIVGIAAPSAAVLKRRNGDLVFGSRRLAGVSDEVVTQNHLITLTVTNAPGPAMGMVGVLSAIYAFDLFVFNEDRRFGNYLSLDDNGVRRFYAFDFSRALFWRWPWKSFPIGATNTYLCGRILRHQPEPPRLLGGVGFDVGVEPVHPGGRRPVPFSPCGTRRAARSPRRWQPEADG